MNDGGVLTRRLEYRPPYDFNAMLAFLRGHALPGIETVDLESYARTIHCLEYGDTSASAAGWMRVSAWPDGAPALKLELHVPRSARLPDIVGRVRRMFDLDADPQAIAGALCGDARLSALLRDHPGLRLPVGWDGFEIAVRAILGQQVSVAAACTFAARLAQRFGTALPPGHAPHGLTHVFPLPEALADVDLTPIGITRTRRETVRTISHALIDGRVDFRMDRTLDDFVASWIALPGIGPWTAHYIAMRALGHPDAFPAEDLVLQKAVPEDGTRMSARALRARAEAWRPWRGYATLQLWREATSAPSGRETRIPASKRGAAAALKPGRLPTHSNETRD